jgi:REP element-mobilizing transposase RayT
MRQRRSIRLRDHDYSRPGAYFVTICAAERACLFGVIADDAMYPNAWGEIAAEEWLRSGQIRREIGLDAFVVMPNHVHGIVFINEAAVGATGRSPLQPTGPPPRSLGALVAGYKSAVTVRVNRARGTPGAPVWQRNYYEHIIRDEAALERIRRYITENPARWPHDRDNPAATILDPDPL